jgi:hypothetical protein
MAGEAKTKQFGVYQKAKGSFKYGDYRFAPGAVVEMPAEVVKKLDPDASPGCPVKFFAAAEKAQEEIERLKKAAKKA